MNTKSQDQLIYDRAKKKVNQRNTIAFIFMCVYFLTIFILYEFSDLTSSLSHFKTIYLASITSQICIFGLIFLLLSNGKKIFRWMYWLAYLYSIVLLYVPIHYFLHDYFHYLTYGGWLISSILFLSIARWYGKTLKTNRWCKIYYDLEIEIKEGDNVQDIYLSDYEIDDIYVEEKPIKPKKELGLQDISMRLGICIYASLMIFPIILQIFSGLFASIDMQTVFATKDIFVFCIYTALIWTLPVFVYFYNHPISRKLTYLCIVVEIIRIFIYSRKFIGYYTSNAYPIRVFILFILVEIIRYALLIYAIHPIFRMEMPEEFESDDDEYM